MEALLRERATLPGGNYGGRYLPLLIYTEFLWNTRGILMTAVDDDLVLVPNILDHQFVAIFVIGLRSSSFVDLEHHRVTPPQRRH